MSEHLPELESRAKAVVARLDAALERPDDIHTRLSFHAVLSNEVSLELMAVHNDAREQAGLDNPMRLVAIKGYKVPTPEHESFSLKIDQLIRHETLDKAHPHDLGTVQAGIDLAADRGLQPEAELLTTIRELLAAHNRLEPFKTKQLRRLNAQFAGLIEQGTVRTERWVSRELGGIAVHAHRYNIDNPSHYPNVSTPEIFPPFRVAYQWQNHQIVLEDWDDHYEIFKEPLDPLERAAQYCASENIVRDEWGKIVSIIGADMYHEQLIIEAERIAGLRSLEADVSLLSHLEGAVYRLF